MLYLQLLALPDPTDANVSRWNGWRTTRRRAAERELGATTLVVVGERARASRSLFLPGAWWAPRTQRYPPMDEQKVLPVEDWKKPMFGLTRNGAPVGPLLVFRPVADQFRLAWQRVLDGDEPRDG